MLQDATYGPRGGNALDSFVDFGTIYIVYWLNVFPYFRLPYFLPYTFFILIYILTDLLPDLFTPSRTDPFRFIAGSRRR